MSIDMEMERLTLRWAALDAVAMRRRTRSNGFPAGQPDRVVNLEMAALDERLNMLGDEREKRLCQIAKHPASDLKGVCGKLAVAARMLDGEGGPIHQIVEEAVRVLSGQHCSRWTPAHAEHRAIVDDKVVELGQIYDGSPGHR